MDASAYRDDISALSRVRIVFGHQSVGRNLMQGLEELSIKAGVPVRIIDIAGSLVDDNAGVFHTNVGKNGQPTGKIEAFSRLVRPATSRPYDVAILKFCYVDVGHEGSPNPKALVEEYARGVAAIRAAQLGLRIIHVTVPLRADPAGWKTPIKRLLGRPTEEDADNQFRNVYNDELRKRFAGEPLFDIAEVESTLENGKRSFFMNGGGVVFTLAPEYSADGGHLNERGRQRAAAAFAKVVARQVAKEDSVGLSKDRGAIAAPTDTRNR